MLIGSENSSVVAAKAGAPSNGTNALTGKELKLNGTEILPIEKAGHSADLTTMSNSG
jgi:hypothetical protein